MDAFSYLSVLLSIILGLAIQQVLQGYRAVILSRARVKLYAPPLIWSVLLLALVAQHWWASFELSGRAEWSFGVFATILLLTGLIYMMAAIVLPDVPVGEPLDLKEHYHREAPMFFGIGAAAIVWSVLRDVIIDGDLPEPANLAFHLLFLAVCATGALSRREWVHRAIAVAMVAWFVAYIGLLFARL